nr:unnamed protein product [Callosobruchus analis]
MLSTKLKPLYDLCKPGVDFKNWSEECEQVFQLSKKCLTSNSVLTHYDPRLPIFVNCDSSGYGVGAVLSHIIEGDEKPVVFASSTLSSTEQKCSNREREALLALIFAVKKFNKYLYGRKFTLITDHQPLQFIFSKNKNIPTSAAARITRWAIILSGYQYDIQYKKGNSICNADGLSRLPIKVQTDIPEFIYSFNLVNEIPLNADDIRKAINRDILLLKVKDFTLSGWPTSVTDEQCKPYFKRRNELHVDQNCISLGNRVIIPSALRQEVLTLFHEQHILGIVRIKMLIRSYCWWPNINNDVEKFISSCDICQQCQNFGSAAPLLPWPQSPHNFYRIFIDFLKKFNFVFLFIYDQKSKWIDVKLMNKGTNASETIAKLKEVFSIFGLPAELVSDGGPPFHSADFISFCQSNGITPIKSPPGHPPSNGYAERDVQIVKRNLEKALFAERGERITEEQILLKLSSFLFLHRSTPTVSTGLSPSECMLKLKPRTRFDLLKPSSISNQTKSGSLEAPRVRKLFRLNAIVYVKNKETKLWEKGKILKVLSFCTYLVQVGSNVKFVHADSIKSDKSTSVVSDVDLSAQISNTYY